MRRFAAFVVASVICLGCSSPKKAISPEEEQWKLFNKAPLEELFDAHVRKEHPLFTTSQFTTRENVAPFLVKQLESEDGRSREAAAELLRTLPTKTVVNDLVKGLSSANKRTRTTAIELLCAHSKKKRGQDNPDEVIPAVIAALKDPNQQVKELALLVLQEIGDPAVAALWRETSGKTEAVSNALQALLAFNKNTKAEVFKRMQTEWGWYADALATTKDAGVATFVEATYDNDEKVRQGAMRGLVYLAAEHGVLEAKIAATVAMERETNATVKEDVRRRLLKVKAKPKQ